MFRLKARALPRRLPLLALVLLLPLFLQGCWTLEHYSARVRIEADGSYKYSIEGSAVHTATVFALRRAEYDARTGKSKPEDVKKMKGDAEAKLSKDLEMLSKDPRVASITSTGGGRVRFMASGKGSIAGGEIIFQERDAPLSYAQAPGGSLSVRVKDAVVGRNAETLGIKVEGDVTVTLAEGIQVLEHNAMKTPTVPGGAYRWHIESPAGPAPHLVIRLPKQ
ncbi:MAG: hypothetical protein A2051_06000 [Desulfovibrionales bacterium GWA2_65_9]|nr:MAG: hypothetical protein A2051_06000 [Desulfovibrionales bacterium GWA2_65_9]